MILDIEDLANENRAFRDVIYTDETMQIVLMYLSEGEEVGMEKHENTTQFIKITSGSGELMIDDKVYELFPGFALIIPKDTYHNIIAIEDLSFYTIYSGEILHGEDEYEF